MSRSKAWMRQIERGKKRKLRPVALADAIDVIAGGGTHVAGEVETQTVGARLGERKEEGRGDVVNQNAGQGMLAGSGAEDAGIGNGVAEGAVDKAAAPYSTSPVARLLPAHSHPDSRR